MRKITFTISAAGDVKLDDVQGMGTGCQQATQDIEKLLGKVDENSRATTDSSYQDVDPLILHQDASI